MNKRISVVLVAVGLLAGAGCSSDSRNSIKTDVQSAATDVANAAGDAVNAAAESIVRNLATQQGEEQFKNAGHTLDGPLTCEAKVQDGVDKVDVNCTGTTKDGQAAALTGTTDELPGASVVSVKGKFVGTVAGTEVFNVDHLGG
jgi:Tfp pilus assembly protein PilV